MAGTVVLLFGTAVYNAPNAGSVELKGQWYALGMDFSQEYIQIGQEVMEQQLDEEWQDRMTDFQTRKNSSFFAERPQYTCNH